jgi:hypothetical protein
MLSIEAIDRIAAMDADVIVPGQGPIGGRRSSPGCAHIPS